MTATEKFRARLMALQDIKYRDFTEKLIPEIPHARFIGVRTPELRGLAKELRNDAGVQEFLKDLPHFYYEENNLHAALLDSIRDYDACVAALNEFLPHVDNWATCDCMSPKALKKNLPALRRQADVWMHSSHTYTVRYGIGTLMRYFLDENFDAQCLDAVAQIRSEEYYIRMMVAWYFATALAKQYAAALSYIENRRLDPWTHNKAIQKSIESRRIDETAKQYLRSLKQSKQS